jgi:hypothetical protein
MAIGKWAKKKSSQATKAVGKRYGVSYGRRGVRFSKNSMSKIAKDVMMIKSQLNVEKKFVDTDEVIKGGVGQVDGNSQGYLAMDLTPNIAQGVGERQRVGNSLKATGLVLKMNVVKQSYAGGPRRLKVYILRTADAGSFPSIGDSFLDVNPITGVRDYHSNLDYTQLKDGRLKIIRTENIYLASNNDNSLDTPGEAATACKTIAIKLNDVLRYGDNTDNVPENVKYFAVIVADNGNRSTTTNSTLLTVFTTAQNSGCMVNAHSRMWYVDN